MTNEFETFDLQLSAVIRPCRQDDLPTLEWFGLFASSRELFRQTFEAHQRGEAVMLVVEVNGVASGQIWIDLTRKAAEFTGILWAARVFPCLQRLGIGSRLVRAAEKILVDRGFRFAELQVEKSNPDARRLYLRLGYEGVGEMLGVDPYGNPINQWVLRKPLASGPFQPMHASERQLRRSRPGQFEV